MPPRTATAASPDARAARRDAITVAAVGAAYFLAHQLAFLFPDARQVLMGVWPAGGVGLAALLLAPRRLWLVIAVTMFVAGNAADLAGARPLLAGLGFMTANVLESLGCAWLIAALCPGPIRFATVREVLALVAGATLVNAATACLGAAAGALTSGAPFAGLWATWFVADGLGILLVTPVVVAFAEPVRRPVRVRWARAAEYAAFLTVWCATAWLCFRSSGPAHPAYLQPYWLFVLGLWPAYRFGRRGSTFSLLLLAALAIAGTAVRVGPSVLGGATVAERLLLVQLFLGVLGVIGLLVWAIFAETRRADRASRDAFHRLRTLGDNLPDGFVYRLVRDPDDALRFAYVSAGVAGVAGLTAEEVMRDAGALYALVDPGDRERLRQARDASAEQLRAAHDSIRIRRLDGRTRWLQLNSAPRRLADGRVEWDGFTIDVTDRVDAQEALRQSEARFRLIAAQLDDVLFITDEATVITYISPAAERMFGCLPHEMEGRSFVEFLAESDVSRALEAYRDALADVAATTSLELAMRRKDGSVFVGELRSNPFEQDGHLGTIGAIRDVTERRRAEEERGELQVQLHQAQKIESVGRLAGGVAHDFNNSVQAILLNAEMALADAPHGDPLRRYLTDIQTSAQHSADLTAQLLAFARKQTAQPRVMDVNEAVAATLPLLRRLIGEDVVTDWTPASGLWRARMDPTQLNQVLTNLALNARDAIAGVGRLSLATANVTGNGDRAAAHPDLAPGDYVRLTVADDGCGMDAETLAHIFEPFFTTKPVGAGTGLGLATVYGIVRQNGGAVTVESAPGRGTTFAVWLPRVDAPDAAPPPRRDAVPPLGGTETILLVEDESSLLRACAAVLAGLGYSVLVADGPGAALRAAAAHDGSIHLLLTDVVMPEMNGRTLADRLTAARPALKRMYMSGYDGRALGARGAVEADAPFLAKPFAAEELARTVRAVLDGVPVP